MSGAIMAKEPAKNPRRVVDDRSGRKTAPVQVPKELARMLGQIAAHDEVSQGELLDPLIRQWIVTQYERVMREMGQELKDLRDAK